MLAYLVCIWPLQMYLNFGNLFMCCTNCNCVFYTRLQSLEAESKEGRSLSMQLELLKKEKTKLVSQLTAQDSLIEGIRAERMLWGQELAQQGTTILAALMNIEHTGESQ